MTTRRCEAGTLELGAGLEVLVSASLTTLQDDDLLDVVVDSRSSSFELPAWARRAGHEVVDERREGDAYVVTLRSRPLSPPVSGPALDASTFPTSELRRLAGSEPREADRGAASSRSGRSPSRAPRITTGRFPAATASGRTSSRALPTARHARSGTRRAMSPGRRWRVCGRTSSAASRK